MLVVISPAKRLDWAEHDIQTTDPAMQEDAVRLVRTARNLTLGKLKGLMDLSDDLARLNRARFAAFKDAPDAETTRPAMFAFAGDTYQGLEAGTLADNEVAYAQDHLRILSGLYGLLRPLDAIQPYRLEMGSRLKTRRGTTLYDYWRGGIAKAINAQAEAVGSDFLVNCASQEYFGAVPLKNLRPRVITPVFMEDKGSGPKIVSFFAKRARGAMARHMIQHQVRDMDGLRAFGADGYRFQPDTSDDQRLVFVRPYPA